VVELFAGYPQAVMSPAAITAYWRRCSGIMPEAVAVAFNKAPSQSPTWCPSAQLVREIAIVEEKARSGPRPDLTRPALPEPEPELEPGNPFYETLQRYKRGEIPGRQLEGEIVRAAAKIGASHD